MSPQGGGHQYGRKWSHQWPVLYFFLKETERRPQASVPCAVIQCDFQKPTISWACCFCTTNCFHSQSWGETCHPWRRHKSDVLSNRIFSSWWEHRHTGDNAKSWHLIRVNSLSPQKTPLWCYRLRLCMSGPHIRVPVFSYHGHHLSHLHTHLRTTSFPHTANIRISGHVMCLPHIQGSTLRSFYQVHLPHQKQLHFYHAHVPEFVWNLLYVYVMYNL